jgi:hypothetical protein
MKKARREKNMDGLSYFKHVAIVALDFPTNPGTGEASRIHGGGLKRGRIARMGQGSDRVSQSGIRAGISRCIGFKFVVGVKSSIRMARRRVSRLSSIPRESTSMLESPAG